VVEKGQPREHARQRHVNCISGGLERTTTITTTWIITSSWIIIKIRGAVIYLATLTPVKVMIHTDAAIREHARYDSALSRIAIAIAIIITIIKRSIRDNVVITRGAFSTFYF